jgi:RNA polymerase-associated protein RTF1
VDVYSDDQSAYEDQDNDYGKSKKNVDESKYQEASYSDILSVQLKRTDLEKWANTPFFDKTVKGCFVRLAVGMDPTTKEQVYRVTYITGVGIYHRPYRFGKHFLKTTLYLSHGKAQKEFLMELISNSPITEKEWSRYVKVMQFDKLANVTVEHVQKKFKDIQKAKDHIFTDEEITQMIKLKRAHDKIPVNVALKRQELQNEVLIAKEKGDFEKVKELEESLLDLEFKVKDATTIDVKLEQFTQLNARNRETNYKESREAEKALFLAKKQKNESDYDPFARRKTQPKHVIPSQ